MLRLFLFINLFLFSIVTFSAPYKPNININVSEFKKAIYNVNEKTPDIVYIDNDSFGIEQTAAYYDKNRAKVFPDENDLIFVKQYSHHGGYYIYAQHAYNCKTGAVDRSFLYFDGSGKLVKITPDSFAKFETAIFKAVCK